MLGNAATSSAGNYTIDWNALAYPSATLAPAAPDFVLTDQYGYQVRMALVFPATTYTQTIPNPAEDTTYLGGINDIFFGNDPPAGSGGFGENTRTATMNIYRTGTTTNIPVDGLNFLVTDIDPVDSDPVSDRCDFITATGNNGNPTLSYLNGAPTGDGSNATFMIGPSTGPGVSGANANTRTIFTKTAGGTAQTNLNFAANQAHCLYYTNTTSATSDNVNTGSLRTTYPNGTSRASIIFDEVIENALGAATPGTQNASGRGIGVFGAGGFSIASSVTLDKQTTTTSFGAAGDVISYSFIVTNIGPVPMNSGQNIQINDTKIGLINCPAIPAAGIAVGGTHTCTANYTVTAADVTTGSVSNTATAGVGTGTQAFATRLQSNNDIVVVPRRPTLTLVKIVTNDNGGTAASSAFTLSATGPINISGVSGAPAVTNALVTAGTYTLSETNVATYAASAWSCTAGTLTGSSLVLANGQNATCTINNNDIAPILTLVKTVTNDNGGTATTSSVTLSATGPTAISGLSGAPAVTNAAVSAGTYTLAETALSGYTAGAWSCTAGALTGSSLVLTLGQTATCTINNNDVAPILTLVKTVTDTSGGPSTVSSFTLTATGPTTISGLTGAVSVTAAPVNAGSYTLSEAGPSGYTAENWSCTSGTLTGANLVLGVGQSATCTINNIKLPTIAIRKISNGGTGVFNFTGSNGIPAQTITTTTVGGTFSGSASPLTAHDTITTITETMPAAFWQIQTTACTGMGTGGTATLAGNVLTLNALATAAGRNIICTFTNHRRPTVTVQKITTGTIGGAFSFVDTNLTGTIANITTAATNTATPASPTRFIASATGTAVTITETSPLTFVAVGATCSDANSAVSGNVNPVATSSSAALTIPAGAVQIGADINCVFTNAQATPQLVVTKTANVPSVAAAAAPVTYTIAVNNSGNTTLSNIAVTDPLGTVLCPSSGAATVTTLASGATENCSMSYSVPQAVFDSNGGGDGDLDNTATASATYNSAPLVANGSASVGLVISPSLTIDKIPNSLAPVNAGNTISYIYRVTNSGNVTMNNVTISDAHIGFGTPPVPGNEGLFSDVAPTGNSTDAATNASWDVLAPGDVIQFTSNYVVVQADIDNLQ